MEINDALISRLEKLARLKLGAPDRKAFSHDLNLMLEMIEKLEEADLTDVKPLIYPGDLTALPRKDVRIDPLKQELALKNGPDTSFPFFQVPKVIQNKS
ncbi:MAG: Asp-tRNA(Asn)/Glu-tRNA(Gln) amidotransferase subunit GatC [Saprospiraceae bacterium]|nr:Asp-tRNA(Asn)/Glu-tRNA(Gln) amidotransferase subunit GatC [Saprospiraceae bacterium]